MSPGEVRSLVDRVVSRVEGVCREEALALRDAPLPDLLEGASRIREAFSGRTLQLCAIVPFASGACGEDCAFCAQSARWNTRCVPRRMEDEEVLAAARRARSRGARFFSLVVSGRVPEEGLFRRMVALIRRLREETDLHLCASLGLVDEAQARELAEAGLRRLHGNLETGPGFFPRVCTTHRFEDKLRSLAAARAAGLEVCSGGLLGMGEGWEDRVDLALAVREAGAVSVPLNVLVPIPGTPLESRPSLEPGEFLRVASVFRFVLPRARIRFAGGRARVGSDQEAALLGPVDGVLAGDYLTTPGPGWEQDRQLFARLGREVG